MEGQLSGGWWAHFGRLTRDNMPNQNFCNKKRDDNDHDIYDDNDITITKIKIIIKIGSRPYLIFVTKFTCESCGEISDFYTWHMRINLTNVAEFQIPSHERCGEL